MADKKFSVKYFIVELVHFVSVTDKMSGVIQPFNILQENVQDHKCQLKNHKGQSLITALILIL